MVYRAYDLQVQSDVAIPGAPASVSMDAADLRICWGERERETVSSLGAYSLLRDGSLVFESTSEARFICNAKATELHVSMAAGATEEDVAALLTATALPMVLWARGDMVLHAGTALLAGCRRAMAFTGPAGVGKSTLLRALLERGSRIVGDDTLCLRMCADACSVVHASGLPACTLVRAEGAPASANRRVAPVPAGKEVAWAKLGAVVVLERSDSPGRPQPVYGVEALHALLRNLHRPRVPQVLGLWPKLLPRLAALLPSVAVYRWNPCTTEDGLRALDDLTD